MGLICVFGSRKICSVVLLTPKLIMPSSLMTNNFFKFGMVILSMPMCLNVPNSQNNNEEEEEEGV